MCSDSCRNAGRYHHALYLRRLRIPVYQTQLLRESPVDLVQRPCPTSAEVSRALRESPAYLAQLLLDPPTDLAQLPPKLPTDLPQPHHPSPDYFRQLLRQLPLDLAQTLRQFRMDLARLLPELPVELDRLPQQYPTRPGSLSGKLPLLTKADAAVVAVAEVVVKLVAKVEFKVVVRVVVYLARPCQSEVDVDLKESVGDRDRENFVSLRQWTGCPGANVSCSRPCSPPYQ